MVSDVKSVLVTGASGFIGSFCLNHLREAGFKVHAITTARSPDNSSDVQWHTCDLFDEQKVQELLKQLKPTHLLHLAWVASMTSEENLAWIEPSLNLLKSFETFGGKRAVYAGTCFEYNDSASKLNESSKHIGGFTVYGASKHLLHEMAKQYLPESKLNFAWGRIFYLYGPRDNPRKLVSNVITSVLQGKTVDCSEGYQIRDYMHVDDIASALCRVLNSDISGVVNIGSGIPISVRELIHTTAECLSASHLINFGARPMPEHEPLFIVADNIRLKNELNWSPQYSLVEGLANTVDWWRNNLTIYKETSV